MREIMYREALREAMAEEKLDCLITHSAGRFLGGAVRYFTDVQISNYGGIVLFPMEGEMILISHAAPSPPSPPEWMVFNTQRISRPYIPVMNFDDHVYPTEAAEAIKKAGAKTVGIVNKSMFPLSFYEYLKENLPGVTFLDATDLEGGVDAVSSAPEVVFCHLDTGVPTEEVVIAQDGADGPGSLFLDDEE